MTRVYNGGMSNTTTKGPAAAHNQNLARADILVCEIKAALDRDQEIAADKGVTWGRAADSRHALEKLVEAAYALGIIDSEHARRVYGVII